MFKKWQMKPQRNALLAVSQSIEIDPSLVKKNITGIVQIAVKTTQTMMEKSVKKLSRNH